MKRSRSKSPASPTPEPAEPDARWSRAPWWQHFLALAFLFVVNFVLYSRTLDLGFFPLDDPDYVVQNPRIESFSAANLRAMLTRPWFDNYAPVHLLSYALDVALAGGKSARAMHLSNVLWHAWTASMVYLLAFAIRPGVFVPFVAGLLFLTHPAHVEVVAWISSRKDLVATGFGALSMACYVLHRRSRNGRWGWYVGSLASFALASGAKQSVVLLPAVMWVWDVLAEEFDNHASEARPDDGRVHGVGDTIAWGHRWRFGPTGAINSGWRLRGRRFWMSFVNKVPFGAIALLFAWQTLGVQPETHRPFSLYTAAATQLSDLWLLTGLGEQVLYRPAPDPAAAGFGYRWLVVGVMAILWVGPLTAIKRMEPVFVGFYYWILILLVPPIIMRFTTPVTDRYLFLSSVGLCIGLAIGFGRLAAFHPRLVRLAPVLPCLLACLWGIRTIAYLAEWRDPRSVWYGAKAKSGAFQVFLYLGRAYQDAADRLDGFVKKGSPVDVAREVSLAEAVLADAPRVDSLRAEWTGTNSSRTHSARYRDRLFDLAWIEYEEAAARRGKLNSPALYLRRGRLLASRGRYEQAVPELKIGFELARISTNPRTRQEEGTHLARAVGIAYWGQGDRAEALRWYQQAEAIQNASGRVWIASLPQESAALERELQTGRP